MKCYFEMDDLLSTRGRKRWRVIAADGHDLGAISWYPGARKYAFEPAGARRLTADCLMFIAGVLTRINQKPMGRRAE